MGDDLWNIEGGCVKGHQACCIRLDKGLFKVSLLSRLGKGLLALSMRSEVIYDTDRGCDNQIVLKIT